MKLNVLLGALLLLPSFMVPAQATISAAEQTVRETTDQVVERLTRDKAELQAHPERIYSVIHELVLPRFDFNSMSKWVLGSAWRGATPEQREAFINEFRTLLVRTYAKALLEYSEEEIRVLPSDPGTSSDSNLVVVKTEVAQPGGTGPIPIHYRMHVQDGNWKVVDVAVDGVSLVSTYRGSFASEIQKGGLDALIAKLSERNRRGQTDTPVGEPVGEGGAP